MDWIPHSNGIANYSKMILNEHHISVLSRGLKFCPTPSTPDVSELREDMDKLHKRLWQIAFFEEPGNDLDLTSFSIPAPLIQQGPNLNSLDPFKHRKFKLPSKGRGPVGPNNLEAMIAVNENEFNSRPPLIKQYRDNLTPNERKALKELMDNKDIIIKSSDKGGAICIQDRQHYLEEGYRQLTKSKYYTKLDHDITETHRVQVQNFIEDMFQNGEIDITVKEYLTDTTCRCSELYLLAKLHKFKFPLPARPVIFSLCKSLFQYRHSLWPTSSQRNFGKNTSKPQCQTI